MCKRFVFYGCIVIFAVLLSFSPISTYAANTKVTLVIGLNDQSEKLDPGAAQKNTSIIVIYQLYDSLVTFKEGDFTKPVPALAESWEIGEDGKTWTFHLRKNATFTSGNPVNADAVIFSLRRALKISPVLSWILTQFGISEESITKIDEHTVQIVLGQQYAPTFFLSCLSVQFTSILDPAVVMEHEKNGDMGSAWIDTHSAGSGRFVLEERKPGKGMVLKANPHYWGEKPSFDTIILKHVPEPITQMALLEKGEIDMAWNLQPEQLKRLITNPKIQIVQSYIPGIRHIMMNLAYDPLSKSDVRDAIRYAIDYDGLVEHILGGAAIKIQTLIPKGVLGYNSVLPYSRDLAKAQDLLVQGDYPDGFEVELICFNDSVSIDVAMKIKADLADIGITLNVKPLPPEKVIERILSRNFQMYHGSWTLDYVDPSGIIGPFTYVDSLEDDATFKNAAWMCHYMNPEVATLVKQADQELDQEKRAALYKQITDIILDDGPYAVLFSLLQQYAIRTEIADRIGPPLPFAGFPTIR